MEDPPRSPRSDPAARTVATTAVLSQPLPLDEGADTVEASPAEAPRDRSSAAGRRLGRYQLRRWLGAGGMGSVYEADDPSLDRPVAIKLLQRSMDEDARRRMEREARALARLSHPNVVQIYEIGQSGSHTFIAMELVRGQTLDAWHAGRPAWRECVRVYLQAGAGLAAAHAEGLVHRDFKPSNCILGDDGRVRVLDFGLARQREAFASESEESSGAVVRSGAVASDQLTQTGTFIGTPAYMPLEQLEGKVVDAAGDQFSFCVSLYEALYGERPFRGRSTGELAAAVARGVEHVPERGHGVPSRVRRVVVRGLGRAPEDRWPSMDELLAELSRLVQPRRRRWVLGLLGGGLLVGGGGMWQQARVAGQRCRGAAEQLAGVWDPDRRAEVRASLLETELPYARTTADRVETRLSEYADAWARMHQATCEATHVRREQSEDVMTLRMACLSSRRIALREAVDVLAGADAGVAQRAVELVSQLDPLTRCEDVEGLRAELPPPDDEAAAAEVQALRARLARAAALDAVGRFEPSLEQLEALWTEAEALGYEPLLAEIEHRKGIVLQELGQDEQAEQVLRRGWSRAVVHGHDAMAMELANMLVFVTGAVLERPSQGQQWGTVALAFAERRRDASVEASVLVHIGMVDSERGATDEALEHLREGLAIKERLLGPEHIHVAITLGAIASALESEGRFEESLEHWERVVAIDEAALGAEHPHVASDLANMGRVLVRSGQLDAAQAKMERARSIFERLGDRANLAPTLAMLGRLRYAQGRLDDAANLLEESANLIEAELGPEHLNLSVALGNLANVRYEQQRLSEAIALLRRALTIREAVADADSLSIANLLSNLSVMVREDGRLDEAQHLQRRALDLYQKAHGPVHPNIGELRFELGQTLEQAGKRRLAREQVERAHRVYLELRGEPDGPEVIATVERWLEEHPATIER